MLRECAEVFQPTKLKDCDGIKWKICLVVHWAMLGARLPMCDAQYRVELRDA